MRWTPFLLPACIMASACSSDSAPTIASIIDQHEALNGKTVRVQGWVLVCQPLNCPLFENADGSGKNLSIGKSKAFDEAILRNGGAAFVVGPDREVTGNVDGRALYVEIRAQVDRTCFDHSGENRVQTQFCFDRAGEMQSPLLIKVIKSAPMPKQGQS